MNPLPALLVLTYLLALASLLRAVHAMGRERLVVGDVVARELPGRGLRAAGSVLLVAIGVTTFLLASTGVQMFVPLLAVALAVNVLRPGEGDRVAGTEGVRAGWTSRAFEELEEWRLTGDHLRFRLFGQWTAVPLPLAEQAPVRARLEAVAGERESVFNQ